MQKLNLTGTSKHQTDDQMKGLSAIFVDGDEVFVDNGAIHAKSRLEVGVKFVPSLDEVPNPRRVEGVWVTLKRQESGLGYTGAMPFELWIDSANKLGYKKLSDHVNQMDKAVRGQVDLSRMSSEAIQKVGQYVQTIRPDLWENATDAFRSAFSS
ncbi:YwhD family protein [Alicyclobacillus fastidiosus]|uniref:YwhD family protein n=1 Tax=Alicyclobacillus fastidiosus TaxID=392011 RepID=A0ABY6ZD35_9BACL|nr:YwhD family protein [Alicyclobacillus fastidiosus]WAH40764.1 YwhD family protein [Alicyclobacillus fastidiosus]GMA62237.1 hypothetical protein GCM10025859_26770 [Alicyclobacillus fastidiosus]